LRLQKKINRACYISTISNFTKAAVQKHLVTKNIPVEVIYCGVINTEKSISEKPEELYQNEQFFFHISTIQPKKNVMALVDMMKLMPEKKLVIAGSWESNYAKEILHRIESEKLSNIKTLSKISTEEKAWLFQNCEAFFFPSLQEGFGLPVIEAMYCGKPVFSSIFTSLPEIGSDKAFYWNNFEPVYMKNFVIEQMERIKNDDQFSSLLKKYAHEFTWEKNVIAYISLFKNLLL
jgi:glycosyltransferase involved in cell wall biosynthesis